MHSPYAYYCWGKSLLASSSCQLCNHYWSYTVEIEDLQLYHVILLLFPQHLGTCYEVLCCHLLTPFYSGFFTLTSNDLVCPTFCSSCLCMLLQYLQLLCVTLSTSFCFVFGSVLLVMCLWHQTLWLLFTGLILHSGLFASQLSLFTGNFIGLFDYS